MKYIDPKLKSKIESLRPTLTDGFYKTLMATAEEDPTVARHIIESIENKRKQRSATQGGTG